MAKKPAQKFRFYISDPFDGAIKGTDNSTTAQEFAASDDFFVIDSETGESLLSNGKRTPIKPVKG